MKTIPQTKCFTFYSYKGGSGRTTTLLNVAKHLAEELHASEEQPILLVDADLESAGLTYFFNCAHRFSARFNCTIHAEAFLKHPKDVLCGVIGDNTFGKSRERLVACQGIAKRIANLYPNYNVAELFDDVYIRETTLQILTRIVEAHENCDIAKKNVDDTEQQTDREDIFLSKTYDLDLLFNRLFDCGNDTTNKSKAIENFVPSDSFVDVSDYFGLSSNSIKFIGVDVAFNGVHSALPNDKALVNKRQIVNECSKNGYSAILFDCGAGVQSTAHVLNHISDVLVYCMRPTYQFISGTSTQLINYADCLTRNVKKKKDKASSNNETCDKKAVILLPTAVPFGTQDTNALQKDSFTRIKTLAATNSFIDSTFCSYENSLKEISLFKWREHILGTTPVNVDDTNTDSFKTIELYSDLATMPEDAKNAYNTYKLVAQRLIYNA